MVDGRQQTQNFALYLLSWVWPHQVEISLGILAAKHIRESFGFHDAIHKAIHEFLELWNTLLSKPFNLEYTGEGLVVKAVKRFIGMLNAA